MAESLVDRFKPTIGRPHPLDSIELIPSAGGIFEVYADGRKVFSKKEVGRHTDADEIEKLLRQL